MQDSDFHIIKKLFPYFHQKDIKLFLEWTEFKTFEPHEELIQFDTFAPNFYYTIEGLIRGAMYTKEGEEHTLYFSEKGRYFITPETLLNKKRTRSKHFFQAIMPTRVLFMNHEKLVELSKENEALFTFYHDALINIMAGLNERVILLNIENADERYRHLQRTRPYVVEHAQKNHIAEFLGILPTSFSRILRKLKD